MAFLISNLSPSPLFQTTKLDKLTTHQTKLTHLISVSSSNSSLCPVTKLESPPTVRGSQDKGDFPSSQGNNNNQDNKNDFYVNLGLAVRTLREDMPLLFSKDLNYNIYRDDITLIDPLNTFTGIEKYKLIFWALRFHGRLLFRDISLEIFRIWQPSENVILIRWNLRGVPRVPWEAKGQFQGTSSFCAGFGDCLPDESKSYILLGPSRYILIIMVDALSGSEGNFGWGRVYAWKGKAACLFLIAEWFR
ncbi:hypothetical protein AQUCO_03000319v1 [Aquilegia coerulea]|uniref:Uncharacterized protein n=1 Tax=Aquilegia coerulea TaxID=218851 RepID=A0A2G5D2F1_AQUCA|nr:hypothetical protein AQUCO_03000319v1 [Aquilegia coerulea]